MKEEQEAGVDSNGLSDFQADPVRRLKESESLSASLKTEVGGSPESFLFEPESAESSYKRLQTATNDCGKHLGQSGAQISRNGCSRREGSGCPTGDKFDAVIGSDVVHEERMADGVLSALKRYLSPNGLAVIVNPHSHHRAGVETFRGLLKKEGFRHEVIGIDGQGLEQKRKARTSIVDEKFGSFHAEERQDVRCLSDGMARYDEEMNDVRLELHLISFRTT
jgi:hypothetical protein